MGQRARRIVLKKQLVMRWDRGWLDSALRLASWKLLLEGVGSAIPWHLRHCGSCCAAGTQSGHGRDHPERGQACAEEGSGEEDRFEEVGFSRFEALRSAVCGKASARVEEVIMVFRIG